jgi:SAM-dependent methyltransferase
MHSFESIGMTQASSANPTIAAYNQYHQVYDEEVAAFWNKFPQTTVQAFCNSLPGNNVLNVGSGSGRDAVILRGQGLTVTCLDASPKMVEMTRQLGFPSRVAEFSHMQLPAQEFDGAWAYTSLIHVPPAEAAQAIQAVARALKPHGTLLIGIILGQDAGMVTRKTMPGAQRYFKYYTKPEITNLVSPLGFELCYEEEYQPHNTIYLSQVYKLAA